MPEYFSSLINGLNGNPSQRAEAYRQLLQNRALSPTALKLDAAPEPLLTNTDSRRLLYKLWWAYYNNTVYHSMAHGGFRGLINEYLGDLKVGSLAGLYNPVERAVEAYQYVFDGAFGDNIKLDEFQPDGKTKLNGRVKEAIDKIWLWSNMTETMELATRYAAVLGTVGLRLVSDPENRRVYFVVEHPKMIRDVSLDNRGNIAEIILEYEEFEGEFEDEFVPKTPHSFIQYMSKTKFWMKRDGLWWNPELGKTVERKEDAEIPNHAGFVPYILLKIKNVGIPFGVPCFYGQDGKINHLNALSTHISVQIHRHVTATWVIEGGGQKPEKMTVGDMNIIYIQRELGQTSAASMKALVADLKISEAGTEAARLQEELSNSMPELKATDGAFLSHQSRGTVAQLRTPAEQRIKKARKVLEEGLVRAQKMAVSYGIMMGLWDVGTGMGNRKVADDAYAKGVLDHRFPQRPALPLSVTDQLILAKAVDIRKNGGATNNGGDNTGVPASGNRTQKKNIPDQTEIQLEAAENAGGSSTGA